MLVLSVPGRRDVCQLHLFVLLRLLGPIVQAGPPAVVEVAGTQLRLRSVQRFSALLGKSDYDHLRGEVRVRFFAPPSDVADQNPHDGCHRLRHHKHDSCLVSDLSFESKDKAAVV